MCLRVHAVPRTQLALAKVAQAGGGAVALTPHQLGSLTWDEVAMLASPKLSAPPLQLTDGDVLVVRDRMHPPPPPLASATPSTLRERPLASRLRVVGFRDPASRQAAETGVHIRPAFD